MEDKDAPIIDKDSNSFIEPLCGRRIQFDTIHGVKGETHDATLIWKRKEAVALMSKVFSHTLGSEIFKARLITTENVYMLQ